MTASLFIGLLLAVVPWTPWWDANYLLQSYPQVRALVLTGIARGIVTGIGLVNVLLGLDEALDHLRAREEA